MRVMQNETAQPIAFINSLADEEITGYWDKGILTASKSSIIMRSIIIQITSPNIRYSANSVDHSNASCTLGVRTSHVDVQRLEEHGLWAGDDGWHQQHGEVAGAEGQRGETDNVGEYREGEADHEYGEDDVQALFLKSAK